MNKLGIKMIAWLLCCCMTFPDAAAAVSFGKETATVLSEESKGEEAGIGELQEPETPAETEVQEPETATETEELQESETPSETEVLQETERLPEAEEKSLPFSIEIKPNVGMFNAEITYSLKNVTEGNYTVGCSCRKQGETSEEKKDTLELTAENNYEATFVLREGFSYLKPDTEYCFRWELKEGEELIDTRESTVKTCPLTADIKVATGLSSIEIDITLCPESIDKEWRFSSMLYLREKGAAQWERNVYLAAFNDSKLTALRGFINLKSGTEYEAVIGDNMETAEGIIYKSFSFSTKEDSRSFSVNAVHTDYTKAWMSYSYEGKRFLREDSYFSFFYREKGEQEWKSKSGTLTSEKVSDFIALKGLKPDTEYEYVAGLLKSVKDDELEDMLQKKEGTFSTKKAEHKLEIEQNISKTTATETVLDLRLKNCPPGEDVRADITLSTGKTYSIYFLESANWGQSQKITELAAETEYRVTKAELFLMNEEQSLSLMVLEPDYVFCTKEIEMPESILLSRDKLVLNLYNNKQRSAVLRTTVTPATADGTIIWSSDNLDVAEVDGEGKVTAKGSGEAVITASCIDGTTTAKCKVTVKKYFIGCEKEDGSIEDISGSKAVKQTGESLEGIKLYERDQNGNTLPVKGFLVSTKPAGIAAWDGNYSALKMLAEGKTEVSFEKDGAIAQFSLEVKGENAGHFAIKGLKPSDSRFPAIEEDGSYVVACGRDSEITYTANGIVYSETFSAEEFLWESSQEQIAQVDAQGVITTKAPGKAVISVTAKEEAGYTHQGEKTQEIILTVKETPVPEDCALYALTNFYKKVKNIPFPESMGKDWQWAQKETKLYSLPVHEDAYNFPVIYTGKDKYPYEGSIPVYIGTIKKAELQEVGEGPLHKGILTVTGQETSDVLKLSCKLTGNGALPPYEIRFKEQNGLTIKENDEGIWCITASKTGKYTLKAEVMADGKVAATASYKLTAVKEKQASEIDISVVEGEAVLEAGGIELEWNPQQKNKTFTLSAAVKDRNGAVLPTQHTAPFVAGLGVVPVYGEEIEDIRVVGKSDDIIAQYDVSYTEETGYYVVPDNADQETGGEYRLRIDTQSFYLSSPKMEAEYTIVIPKGYEVEKVEFDSDCDKDGTRDFEIISDREWEDRETREDNRAYIVWLSEKASLSVPKAGKTYNIPVTLYMEGRDGKTKDSRTVLKVKVKQ